jgi:CO/xanthine dehydrogenase FAD-binding subunit
MDEALQTSQVFLPSTLTELFAVWDRFPDARPFAGGLGFVGEWGGRSPALPANVLCLDKLDELRHIRRTERYIEMGAMVRLNDIIRVEKTIPRIFAQALKSVAGPELRNLATIGGHICCPDARRSAAAPLIAIDARCELRTASASRWVSAARFLSVSGPPPLGVRELLTRVRVPLEQWHYSRYRRFGDGEPSSAVFIARDEKNILTDLRAVYAGETVLYDRNSEVFLSGRRLPLDRRDAAHFTGLWRSFLAPLGAPSAMIKAKILNFMEEAVMELSE